MVSLGYTECKDCVRAANAAQFQKDRESLSDRYVKRQISKRSGLRSAQIPSALIEAERVRLMIERALPSPEIIYIEWLRRELGNGPVNAEQLKRRARTSGFRPEEYSHARRKAGAVYDQPTNTWRIE